MALVVMFLFSLLGLATAAVGFLGFGFALTSAITFYVIIAASGPLMLLIAASQTQVPDAA